MIVREVFHRAREPSRSPDVATSRRGGRGSGCGGDHSNRVTSSCFGVGSTQRTRAAVLRTSRPRPTAISTATSSKSLGSSSRVQDDGKLLLKTRRGKTHVVEPSDPNLRHATLWDRLRYRTRFAELRETAAASTVGNRRFSIIFPFLTQSSSWCGHFACRDSHARNDVG